jgi:hypothetical protein
VDHIVAGDDYKMRALRRALTAVPDVISQFGERYAFGILDPTTACAWTDVALVFEATNLAQKSAVVFAEAPVPSSQFAATELVPVGS